LNSDFQDGTRICDERERGDLTAMVDI
jgi:hypothetical protein